MPLNHASNPDACQASTLRSVFWSPVLWSESSRISSLWSAYKKRMKRDRHPFIVLQRNNCTLREQRVVDKELASRPGRAVSWNRRLTVPGISTSQTEMWKHRGTSWWVMHMLIYARDIISSGLLHTKVMTLFWFSLQIRALRELHMGDHHQEGQLSKTTGETNSDHNTTEA